MGNGIFGKVLKPGAILTLFAFAFALAPSAAFAIKAVNTNFWGVAIKGYDPVSYFTERKPVKGKGAHRLKWMGATWKFSNPENRDLFQTNPEKYAPQYGGYCAFAVSQGATADIDPRAWTIVNGKLYLNLSLSVQKIWEKDIPGYIAKADINWPKILNGK